MVPVGVLIQNDCVLVLYVGGYSGFCPDGYWCIEVAKGFPARQTAQWWLFWCVVGINMASYC